MEDDKAKSGNTAEQRNNKNADPGEQIVSAHQPAIETAMTVPMTL